MAKAIPAGPTVPRNRSGSITAGSVISHVASCTQLFAIGTDNNAAREPNVAKSHAEMNTKSGARWGRLGGRRKGGGNKDMVG